jgi:hypothetical protein
MGATREVPINPKHPPVINFVAGSPRVQQQMRSGEQVSFSARTGSSIRATQTRVALSPARNHVSQNQLSQNHVSQNQVRVTSQGNYSRASSSGSGASARVNSTSSSGGSHK